MNYVKSTMSVLQKMASRINLLSPISHIFIFHLRTLVQWILILQSTKMNDVNKCNRYICDDKSMYNFMYLITEIIINYQSVDTCND